jgi:hypothetical protein
MKNCRGGTPWPPLLAIQALLEINSDSDEGVATEFTSQRRCCHTSWKPVRAPSGL